jgi:hypothetical protein
MKTFISSSAGSSPTSSAIVAMLGARYKRFPRATTTCICRDAANLGYLEM